MLLTTYAFVKIADTVNLGPGSFTALSNPTINDQGVVAFNGSTSAGSGIFTGSGAATSTVVAPASGTTLGVPAINNSGAVAYTSFSGSTENLQVTSGGSTSTLVSLSTFNGANFRNPSFNDAGQAAYVTYQGASPNSFITRYSGGAATVVSAATFPDSHTDPAINAAGAVAFSLGLASGPGIFTVAPNGTTTATVTNAGSGLRNMQPPDINAYGDVAFEAVDSSNRPFIEKVVDGNLAPVAFTTLSSPSSPFSALSTVAALNDAGTVVFRATLTTGGLTGLFTGMNTAFDKVIARGDALFGSSVNDVTLIRDGLNNNGQIAFVVTLVNGRTAIVRADPTTSNPVVTTTADSGSNTNPTPGSLREAILKANSTGDRDTIRFNIPGSGVLMTHPNNIPLPALTSPMTLDGYSQAGSSANTLAVGDNAVLRVWIYSALGIADAPCLSIANTRSVRVRGLAVENSSDGPAITIVGGDGHVIEGNFLGTDPGTVSSGGKGGVLVTNSTGNRIGTDGDGVGDIGERNLIACSTNGPGTLSPGIMLSGSRFNVIAGNYIGVDITGIKRTFGLIGDGVLITAGSSSNRVGTNADGVSDALERNVISATSGVTISNTANVAGSDDNAVAGNYIGLGADGMTLVSGGYGVSIGLDDINHVGPRRNRIGTNGDGVRDDIERNVISGNAGAGVHIGGGDSRGTRDNVVAGNYVGTDATGLFAVPNGTGISIDASATANRIGTDADGHNDAAEANLISGNRYSGVALGADGDIVYGNMIGVNAAGEPLGNQESGVSIFGSNNRIGDTTTGAANVIAFNGGAGVFIAGGSNNAVLGNSIHDNGGLGIDTSNEGQTFVSIDSSPNVMGVTRVAFTVLSLLPGVPHRVEFFASPAADPSGNGEGQTYLGSTTVVPVLLDSYGQVSSLITFTPALAAGQFLSATVTALDDNTSPFSNASVIFDTEGPSIVSLSAVSPDPRNTPVGSIDVTFSEPIDAGSFDAGDLSLTREAAAVPLAGAVTIQQLTSTTYRINGLGAATAGDGRYTLSVVGTGISDPYGNPGTGSASESWVMDTKAPTSLVNALPQRATTLSFPVSISASDPASPGVTISGLASVDVYVAIDGGPYALWRTLPAGTSTATFDAQSNHSYAFRAVARDRAGNVESKPVALEAGTYVPDLSPPDTHVDSVASASPTFTVSFSGADAGGSGLTWFDLYAQEDGGAITLVKRFAAGKADAGGVYRGSTTYQADADGSSHSYRFFTVGTDAAGNAETAPAAPGDVTVSARFDAPVALKVTGFNVQNGMTERSYIRYLDIAFNQADLLADLIHDGRVRLTRFNLQGGGTPVNVSLGSLSRSGRTLEIDFGKKGIGGDPDSANNDGYYRLSFDLDGDGTYETSRFFYRLLGDVNGDRQVDAADERAFQFADLHDPEADVNGDGVHNLTDQRTIRTRVNTRLASGLHLDD